MRLANGDYVEQVLHGSVSVSRIEDSLDVAISMHCNGVNLVRHRFNAIQSKFACDPSLRITDETAQTLYDQLFEMGFRFRGGGCVVCRRRKS